MKKTITLANFYVFLLLSSIYGQYSVSLVFDTSALKISNGFATFVSTRYHSNSTSTGQPNLPLYNLRYLLAPDADLSTVSCILSDTVTKVLDGTYNIPPTSPICTWNYSDSTLQCDWPEGIVIKDGKDIGVYETNAFFPYTPTGRIQTGMGRQYKLIDVPVYPYFYNPVTQKIKAFISGILTVTFAKDKNYPGLPCDRTLWYEKLIDIDNDTNVYNLYALQTPAFSQTHNRKIYGQSHQFIVIGNRFKIPDRFLGQVNKIRVTDLMGKNIFITETKSAIIQIGDILQISNKIHIVRIN